MSTRSGPESSTVTLEVSSREATRRRLLAAFAGEPQGAVIGFESPALLFKLLTQERWELLAAITGAGAMSIREAARHVDRDVKAVHGDVTAPLKADLLRRTEERKILFPYSAVHVDYLLTAA